MFDKRSIATISLDSAGLIALADLTTVLERTALIGTSWYLDTLFLAPGLHRQQYASEVNGGEFPVAGAMTSGYVFRIENQATVFWMQRVGEPGHLVEARVEPVSVQQSNFLDGVRQAPDSIMQRLRRGLPRLCRNPQALLRPLPKRRRSTAQDPECVTLVDSNTSQRYRSQVWQWDLVFYMAGIASTIICFAVLGSIRDYWAIGVLVMLVAARAVNTVVFRRRAVPGWKGAKEPADEQGDLLILLSQDRWVRLRGTVNDIKLVTSGQWVRDLDSLEGFAVAGATLLVYGAAALAPNASTIGSLSIAVLLLVSAALLGLCNAMTEDLRMLGCRISQCGKPKEYERRKQMAEEMIEEHGGRRDWAVGMGLVLPEKGEEGKVVV